MLIVLGLLNLKSFTRWLGQTFRAAGHDHEEALHVHPHQHGDHLPLGTDFLNGFTLCDLAAQKEPAEAVKAYHGALQKQGIKPARTLANDSEITEEALKAAT